MPIETHVNSSGETDPKMYAYQLGAETRSLDGVEAQKAVVSALSVRGINPADNAPSRLDITFSTLPAALQLSVGEALAAQAKIRKPKPSKKCDPVEYRLGVALTNISNGAVMYRSSASEYHCKGNETAIIPILSEAALKDLGSPKGIYVVERKVKR